MYLVVVDSFNCSSQRATDAEKLSTTKTWSRILIDVIPALRLQDAFDHAFVRHSSPFPVNAYDLKMAWEEIAEAERIERERIEAENRAVNRVAYCPDKYNHRSEADAMQEYQVGTGWVWLPCAICRTDAYWQRVKEVKARNKENQIDERRVGEVLKSAVDSIGLRLVKNDAE